jgi:hypothetical protein
MKKNMTWIFVGLAALILVAIGLVAANFSEKPVVIVRISPKLTQATKANATHHKVVYVTLFGSDSPMPYAAMREYLEVGSNLDLREILVTAEKLTVMNPGREQPQFVRVKVRLDADGAAGPDQPGDITGQAEQIQWGGNESIPIVLDKFIME